MWSESSRQVFVKHARREGVTVDKYIAYQAARIAGHRIVTADAVAKVCVFLASDGTSAINGQCIVADGGEYWSTQDRQNRGVNVQPVDSEP